MPIILYMSSTPSTLKIRTEISRLQQILAANAIEFEEVDLSLNPERRDEMAAISNLKTLPQLHANGKASSPY